MELNADEIRRLADLSRIQVSDEELPELEAGLNRILEFAAVLAEVDARSDAWDIDWGGNILRADELSEPLGQQAALELAPDRSEDGFLRVPRTVDGCGRQLFTLRSGAQHRTRAAAPPAR